MRDLYNEAITVLGSLEAREEIMRKLRALDIPKVIRELKGYKQVPDSSVVEVMKATFLLLGVNEKELNVCMSYMHFLGETEGKIYCLVTKIIMNNIKM